MITNRGKAAAAVAGALAIAGVLFGVEEFVLFSIAVAILFVTGLAALGWRTRNAGRSLTVAASVPRADVVVGQHSAIELVIANSRRWRAPPVVVDEPGRNWVLSFPGLGSRNRPEDGEGARAISSQSSLAPTAGQDFRRASDSRVAILRFIADESRLRGRPSLVPPLGHGAQAVVKVPVPTGARGLLSLAPLRVWCEDPLRLMAWRIGSTPVVRVLVCPAPGADPTFRAPSVSGGNGVRTPRDSENTQAEGMRGGYEFRALRSYVPGDRITRLHWPAFARSEELVVRDFVEPVSGCVSLLVDLRPGSHGERSLEAVISSAAAVGLRAIEEGQVVELCTSSGERVEIGPGVDSSQILLRSLAVLGPSSAPMSSALRWSGNSKAAVWAAANAALSDVVLVTTASGVEDALAPSLEIRAAKVVVA